MATKKNNPNVQKRISERKAFVASKPELSKEVARKRFYVQTRAKELEAAGKTVDRAALRKKFETTTIQRAGFQTAQDIQKAAARRAAATSASSEPLPSPSVTGRTPSDSTRTRAATTSSSMMGQRRKAVPGFKSGNVQPSSIKKQGNADRLAGNIGRAISSSLESIRATFIAPAWNDWVGAVKPEWKIREAGTKEKLVTGVSFFLGGGAGSAAIRGTTSRGALALGPGARGALGPGARALGPGPRAIGPGPRAIGPGPRPVSAARTAAGRARADAAFKSLREAQAAPKAVTKAPAAKTTKAPVAKTQKPVAKTTKAPAAKAQKPVAKKAPAAKTQKPVAKKATAKKAAPQPVKAATRKAAAPKASAPVKAPATQSPKMVTSTGRSSTSAGRAKAPVRAKAPSTTRRFSSQAEYNKFMDTGGKEALRNMSTQEQQAFTQLNRGWIIGRSRATQAQARSRAAAEELRRRAIASRNKNMASRARKKGLTFSE